MNELDSALDRLHRDARASNAPLADARARLMDAIDAEAAYDTNVVVALRPRRRRRLVLPIAAAAASILAVTAVVIQVGGPAEPAPAVSLLSATEVLDKAADVSVGAVQQPLAPGQFRYILEHTWVTRGVQALQPAGAADQTRTGYTYLWEMQTQRWIPANDHDTWQETRKVLDPSKFLGGTMPESQAPVPAISATDQGQWQGKCGDFFPKSKPAKVCGDPNDWDSPTFYQKLPNDPDRLYAVLTDLTKGRGSGPSVMFHYGIEILRSGLMPAELRGPWYRALAKIPGIKVIDTETNLDGRVGTALGLDDGQEQRQLIIDRTTGEFIGERSVAGPHPYDPWIKPGTVTGSSAISTAVVDSLGAVPVH